MMFIDGDLIWEKKVGRDWQTMGLFIILLLTQSLIAMQE